MLALTIKVGEKIHIGEEIEISVAFVRDGNIRLSFTAPRHVEILREKIFKERMLEHALHGTGESREQKA